MIVLTKIYYLEPSLKCDDRDPDPLLWTSRKPRQLLIFNDLITGERRAVTDLQRAKNKREGILRNYFETYWESYLAGNVTMVSAVVDADEYKDVSMVIRCLKKRLLSRNAELLGYVCCRDKGDKCQRNHFHLHFAAKNLDLDGVKLLYTTDHSSAQTLETKYGMLSYLSDKELIGPFRKNAYTRSRVFKAPNLSDMPKSEVRLYKSPRTEFPWYGGIRKRVHMYKLPSTILSKNNYRSNNSVRGPDLECLTNRALSSDTNARLRTKTS